MRARLAILAGMALAGVTAIVVWRSHWTAEKLAPVSPDQRAATTRAATPRPTPILSPEFAQVLEGLLEMNETEAAGLELRLAEHPDDLAARARLMAYLRRADRDAVPQERAKRWKHATWLIEHQPESEILHSWVAQFERREVPAESVRRAERLWEKAIQSRPADARVVWNAAQFFQNLDADLHLTYLEATVEANPNHPHALLSLAQRYAGALMTVTSPLASRAERGLERSRNVWVLGNAAAFLQAHYNQTVMMRAPDPRLAKLAERYFERAQAIDPSLDRQAILPRVDPRNPGQDRAAAQAERARFEKAAEGIRRVRVESFKQLPVGVAGVLRARGCTVPQPAPEAGGSSGLSNVIRGEFFERGKVGWAVLCSVNQTSTLLVFRGDVDLEPDELSRSDDRNYLQGLGDDAIGYSREIRAVQGDFILRHYRAYGGPKPPQIDHFGIDDAFLGKASVTWYFHLGKWMPLQGAD